MELFLILFLILFFSLATIGYGYFLLNIINHDDNYLSIGEIGFLGFFFISLISIFAHFFIPLNLIFNTTLYTTGFIYLILKYINKKKKIGIF